MRVAHRHHVLQVSQADVDRSSYASLVECQPPAGDCAAPGGATHRFGVGHGGHLVGSHEAGEFQLGDAGGDECLVDRQLGVGGDRRLVLESIAQGHVPQGHLGRCHWSADGAMSRVSSVPSGASTSVMASSTSSYSVRSARDITACCRYMLVM